MNRYFAFFDVDGTIINLKSMFSFLAYDYQERSRPLPGLGALRYRLFSLRFSLGESLGADRRTLNRQYYRAYRGRKVTDVRIRAARWYSRLRNTQHDFFIPEGLAELRRHQQDGGEIVFVSGSFPELLAPLAQELGVRHQLSTRMEIQKGRYSGEIHPPQMIGPGKAEAVQGFLARMNADSARCYAYGDHISDLPMLEAVAHPRILAGDPALEAHARKQGWPILGSPQ